MRNREVKNDDLEFSLLRFIEKHQKEKSLDTINMFNSFKDNIFLLSELEDSKNEEYCIGLINQIVKINQRLVQKIANKYIGQSGTLNYEDLVNEGNLGLLKAIEKFDVSKEIQFSTYATWWIRQAITRAIANKSLNVRVPVQRFEKIRKMRKLESKMVTNSDYNFEAMLNELDISKEQYNELKLYEVQFFNMNSVNAPMSENDDSELLAFISANSNENFLFTESEKGFDVELSINQIFLREDLEKILSSLTDREYSVLSLRFGLGDGHERTLEEIGCIFGLTRERIRQIEAKALNKLRTPNNIKLIYDYYIEQ
ncbi:RNA polymerase sigma factor RpoD/SigA [Bacillus cereus group sp. BfR-BA-01408]|uniref:sigma-70 family RNA polymerase sigma factor n=1 Tax=Bacillus cereus group sp. BfR-BA-01408 TaxID=2920337 RepID=UPI001F57D065|nr:sigma-70 family RNA polymerase sigma factor [Bacillus cereus group sp. BfR-BA-01408]